MSKQEFSAHLFPTVWFPDDLEEAWKLKRKFEANACSIAGGTLLQTNWRREREPLAIPFNNDRTDHGNAGF